MCCGSQWFSKWNGHIIMHKLFMDTCPNFMKSRDNKASEARHNHWIHLLMALRLRMESHISICETKVKDGITNQYLWNWGHKVKDGITYQYLWNWGQGRNHISYLWNRGQWWNQYIVSYISISHLQSWHLLRLWPSNICPHLAGIVYYHWHTLVYLHVL